MNAKFTWGWVSQGGGPPAAGCLRLRMSPGMCGQSSRGGGGQGSSGSHTRLSEMASAETLCAGGRSTGSQAPGCCGHPGRCCGLGPSGARLPLREGFWSRGRAGNFPCRVGRGVWEVGSGWDLPGVSWDGWQWCPWGPGSRRLQRPGRPGAGPAPLAARPPPPPRGRRGQVTASLPRSCRINCVSVPSQIGRERGKGCRAEAGLGVSATWAADSET